MLRLIRSIEIIVGLVFVLAAALKALDMAAFATQIRLYGVLHDVDVIRAAAVFSVAIETFLGAALIIGLQPRPIVYAMVLGMLAAFSGLVTYADIYHNLDDCGCFGKFLAMDPVKTVAKNIVMFAMLVGAWILWRRIAATAPSSAPSRRPKQVALVAAAFGAVAACYAFADNQSFLSARTEDAARPFAGFRVEHDGGVLDLGSGTYLVAMLSATCDDCREAVIPLSDLTYYPDVPQVVGLVLATDDEYAAFLREMEPIFASQPIDPMLFFELIGDEPPRFYVVRDGAPIRSLDTLDPTIETLYDFARDAEPSP